MSFKNGDWNYLSMDSVCYQGENEDEGHTKADLINMCNGNVDTARVLYENLDWQSPYTLLDEWKIDGEIDDDFNLMTDYTLPT